MVKLPKAKVINMTLAQPLFPHSSVPSVRYLCDRIRQLVQHFVAPPQLQVHLEDLPRQFAHPRPRPWSPIAWPTIAPSQVKGLSLATYCRVLVGSINTEAPIHGYTQASRQYLQRFHPEMAAFVGGQVDATGQSPALGLWELEEKRHTPALVALHLRLAGHKPELHPHRARPYTPGGDPRADLFRHGLHRIATEYGATCLYLWIMAHSHGPLGEVLAELTRDEVNHMTKFWGFGRWAYPRTGLGAGGGQPGPQPGAAAAPPWGAGQPRPHPAPHVNRTGLGELVDGQPPDLSIHPKSGDGAAVAVGSAANADGPGRAAGGTPAGIGVIGFPWAGGGCPRLGPTGDSRPHAGKAHSALGQ